MVELSARYIGLFALAVGTTATWGAVFYFCFKYAPPLNGTAGWAIDNTVNICCLYLRWVDMWWLSHRQLIITYVLWFGFRVQLCIGMYHVVCALTPNFITLYIHNPLLIFTVYAYPNQKVYDRYFSKMDICCRWMITKNMKKSIRAERARTMESIRMDSASVLSVSPSMQPAITRVAPSEEIQIWIWMIKIKVVYVHSKRLWFHWIYIYMHIVRNDCIHCTLIFAIRC